MLRPRDAFAGAPSDSLSRAEIRALSRSSPLTPAEFKAYRHLAEQRDMSLGAVLDSVAEAPPPAA